MTRGVKIFFTISVLLNMLLVAAVAGMILTHPQPKPWDEVKEELAPETQNLLARTFQSSGREMSDTIGKMRNSREQMKKIFSASEFNEKAFDTASKDMMDAQEKLMTERLRASKEIAKQLPQTERVKIAEQFSKPWGGPHKRSGPHPEYDHPPKPTEKP